MGAFNEGETGVSLILKHLPPTIKRYLFVLFPYLSCADRFGGPLFYFTFPPGPGTGRNTDTSPS